ncbi:pimeloyl-ACP methyl ester carboxylesterase [Mycobacterium sp. URHB0021]
MGDTAAVGAVVARLPRRRGPAACRCPDRRPHRWRAALGYYRAALRGGRPPAQNAGLQQYWLSTPRLSTVYLHGTDDSCCEDYTPRIERILPEGSTTALVENAGHFLQLEQPDVVARHLIDFVGAAR